MSGLKILIAEDEIKMCRILQIILKGQGYIIDLAHDGDEAWRRFQQAQYDLVITDLKMPPKGMESGLELLDLIHKENPHVPVIVITAYGNIDSAVRAMKAGAYDYITKPFENEEIKIVVAKALTFCNLQDENRRLRKAVGAKYNFEQFIGVSPQIRELRQQAARVAQTFSTVLVEAESGTGKELLVRLIHYNSSRAGCPFVAFNCGAFPDTLVESELLGYEKGAFAGAIRRKPGRFELAHNGTIFLDEVGDLSPDAQTKILRVLEEKTFERLGGTNSIQVDVRIIAATNKNLKEMVDEGSFREDLYFRLNVFPLSIPPLRERKEDIPLLVDYFIEYFSGKMGRHITGVTGEAMKLLHTRRWRGNVRELRNCLERAMILCQGRIITPEDLQIEGRKAGGATDPLPVISPGLTLPPTGISLEEVERSLLRQALIMARGNKSEAARLLKISRNTLRFRLEKHGITFNGAQAD